MSAALDRAKKRAEYNSTSNLKRRAFTRRLDGDYNTEVLYLDSDLDKAFAAIVQTSSAAYSVNDKTLDYKKISIPIDIKVDVGEVLYWKRLNKNYLIYQQRHTEKDYFLGYATWANCNITWADKNGKKYSHLGSFMRLIKEDIFLRSQMLDHIDAKYQLILPANAETQLLTYYTRLKIAGKTWKVVGTDSVTFEKIVVIFLDEVQSNSQQDTEDLPEGKELPASKIIAALDGITEVAQNTQLDLFPKTYLNGLPIGDSYTIECEGCEFTGGTTVSFMDIKPVRIKITSNTTGAVLEYSISVKQSPQVQTVISIQGADTVKTMLPYKYKLIKTTNGIEEALDGEWDISPKENGVISIDGRECNVKFKFMTGVVTISCVHDGQTYEKEIKVISLY